jgi:hypothetical protein
MSRLNDHAKVTVTGIQGASGRKRRGCDHVKHDEEHDVVTEKLREWCHGRCEEEVFKFYGHLDVLLQRVCKLKPKYNVVDSLQTRYGQGSLRLTLFVDYLTPLTFSVLRVKIAASYTSRHDRVIFASIAPALIDYQMMAVHSDCPSDPCPPRNPH